MAGINPCLLRNTCTIQTQSVTSRDALGHDVFTWANTYTGVVCRLQGGSGNKETTQTKEAGIYPFTLWLLPTQTITEKDRVVFAGATYQVKGVATAYDGNGAASHEEAELELVN